VKGPEPKSEDPPPEKDSDGDGWNDTYENESGSDPYNPKSTPLDWDGDGVPNEKDAYPHDPTRWKVERVDVLLIVFYVGLGTIVILVGITSYIRIKNLFGNRNRTMIYNYIVTHPGSHYRKAKKRLGVGRGTLTHHLDMLEKANKTKSYYEGPFRYLYPTGFRHEKKLGTPIQKKVLQVIADNPGLTYRKIGLVLGKSTKVVTYHVKNLEDKDLIKAERMGNELHWFFKDT